MDFVVVVEEGHRAPSRITGGQSSSQCLTSTCVCERLTLTRCWDEEAEVTGLTDQQQESE